MAGCKLCLWGLHCGGEQGGGGRGNLVNGQNVVMFKNNSKILSLCSFCGERISLKHIHMDMAMLREKF